MTGDGDNRNGLERLYLRSFRMRIAITLALWTGFFVVSATARPDVITMAQASIIVPALVTAWFWGGWLGVGSLAVGIGVSRVLRTLREIPVETSTFAVGMVALAVVLLLIGRARSVTRESIDQRLAMEAAERRYRALFERVPVGVFRTSPDGRFIDINARFAEMTGFSVEELLAMDAADVYVDPADRHAALDEYERGLQRVGEEVRVRHKDGHVVFVRIYGFATRNAKGELESIEGIAEDVTELRRSEEALQLSNERFRGAFENAPVGMVLVNTSQGILRANAAFGRIVDRPASELIGLNMRDLVHPEDHVTSISRVNKLMNGDLTETEFDERYLKPDGTATWCETHVSAAHDSSGTVRYLIAQIVDVEARKAVQRSLEQLVESKDEFIASVSHELRTPLTVVHGLAHELKDHFGKFETQEAEELAGYIAEQSTEVAAIVEDLLVAARVDSGTVTIHPRTVYLDDEIDLALQSVPRHVAEDVQIDYADVSVFADPTRLRQILRNLLTNADRYGGPKVQVSTGRYEDDAGNGWATVVVVDDGPGVPAEDESRIFGADESAHTRLGLTESVGLGLTVSRQLARLMGGDLVYGRDTGLTMFALHLPSPAREAPPTEQ